MQAQGRAQPVGRKDPKGKRNGCRGAQAKTKGRGGAKGRFYPVGVEPELAGKRKEGTQNAQRKLFLMELSKSKIKRAFLCYRDTRLVKL